MAAFSDPFANLPGILVQKEDGNLNVFREKTGPVVLILGSAGSGPANQLVEVDRVSEAVALFGTSGTLSRGLVEAAQAGAENLAAYRIGATAALMTNIGDRAQAGGASIETVDADASIADDFSVLYEQGASTFVTNAGAYTDNGRVKRLRVYDSSNNLIYDNDPAGGAVVDSGRVLVAGTLDISTRGPSIGKDVQARATDQHNLLIDPAVAGGTNNDEALSRGAGFSAMNFNATSAPMKLIIERAVGHWEEVNIDAIDSNERMNVAVDFPANSRSEEDTQPGLDSDIDAANLAGNGLIEIDGKHANNDGTVVSIFGLDAAGLPLQETLVCAGGGVVAGTETFSTITGARVSAEADAAGVIEVQAAGGGADIFEFSNGGGTSLGLDTDPLPAAGVGLFGACGLHHNHEDGNGQTLVLRGPGIVRQHIMPTAGDQVEVVSTDANSDGITVTVFGYDVAGFPLEGSVVIAGAATQAVAGVFASITGIAFDRPVPAGAAAVVVQEQDANTLINSFAIGDQYFGMTAEAVTLGAGTDEENYVSSAAKFSNLWQVELAGVDNANTTVSYRKCRMFRVIRTDAGQGEPMSQARWANDNWATTQMLGTNTTSGSGISASPLLIPGSDGLTPTKEDLFEQLQDAYRALETTNVDVVVPMGVYLDDANAADDANLVRTLDSGAVGSFLAEDVDQFGRFMVFTDAGGGFDALGLLGPGYATLVITEATFQDSDGNDLRRSAKVLSTGDLDGASTDTKLTLDRELSPNAQAAGLDWILIGNGPLAGPAVVSDHLRYFRQFKSGGQWLYEWWHEADQEDPDGDSYQEVNFAFQLANFCYQLSTNDNNTLGVLGVNRWASRRLADIDNWVGTAPTRDINGNVTVNGAGLLGSKVMMGSTGWTRGMFAVTGTNLANFPASTDIIVDTNGNNVDIGKYISVVSAWPNFVNSFDTSGFGYIAAGASAYAGMISRLEANVAPTNKVLGRGIRMPFKLPKDSRDSLAAAGFIWFDTRDKGVVVDDAPTAALPTSDYRRLTTMRIVVEAVDEVRNIAEPFIGEASTAAIRAAIKTACEKKLADMVKAGYLRRYDVAVTATPTQQILGQATIELVLVPAFELRKITVLVSLARE